MAYTKGEKEEMEIRENPLNRLPKEVILRIFDKLIISCSSESTQSSLKSLCWCSMVSKKFASLFFQTPINTITLDLPPDMDSKENPNAENNTTYYFLSKFISIQTLHFQLSYPYDINNIINDRFASPIVKWGCDIRFSKCCFIFFFARGGGTGLLPANWASNWCLQVSYQKFQVLACAYYSVWSIFHKNKIIAHKVVITDPQTACGSVVINQDHIAEMKTVSPENAGDTCMDMSAKCWITMTDVVDAYDIDDMDLNKADKLVIHRNDDSTEDLEEVIRKVFEGEDEDLVNKLVMIVKTPPTHLLQ